MSESPPPFRAGAALRWLPWFLVLLAGLAAHFFGLQADAARQEAESLRLQLDLRDLELRDARNHREAERLLLNHQIEAAGHDAAAPAGSAGPN